MKSEQIKAELEQLRAQVKPTLQRLGELERSLREATSAEAVAELGLRRSDVAYSSDEGAPWHGEIFKFAQWATDNNPRTWIEWNGWLYMRSEVLDGRMDGNPKIMWESVPAA